MQTVIRLAALLCFVLLSACEPQVREMDAVRLTGTGGPEVLEPARLPVPEPAAGEVLIRVRAAGVNPFDWKLRAGEIRIPGLEVEVPGVDVAGVIESVGAGVADWQVGDEVIAALHRSGQGGYAQYATARADDVARKPATFDFRQAAGIPTTGMAAWQYLVEIAGVREGDRVLVHAAAGGVGSMAVQIAKAKGAYVIGTASPRNHDYLRDLGVDEVIDYRSVRFEDVVHDADIVMDLVGGDTLARSPAMLRSGGVLVSLVGGLSEEQCLEADIVCPAPPRPGADAFGPRLAEIVKLADAGKLKVNVDEAFPLAQAGAAQEKNREGHTRGKIVLDTR